MKKWIAGMALAILAAPAAQAWTGSIEDMRTMEANESGPILRIKGTNIAASCQCGIRQHRQRAVQQRCATPPRQVVTRCAGAARPAPQYQRTQRVVSEKVYTQKVSRYPTNACPLR